MKNKIPGILFYLLPMLCSASLGGNRQVKWQPIIENRFSETETKKFLVFEGATYNSANRYLPEYFERVKLSGNASSVSATLTNEVYEPLSTEEAALANGYSKTNIEINAEVVYERKEPYAAVRFIPLRKNSTTGNYEKLVSFTLNITEGSGAKQQFSFLSSSQQTSAPNSVLATGTWYRVGLTKDGVYKLSYTFLNSLGIDMATIDPRNIRIYGNGGGMLPYANSAFRRDDLAENAIMVQGENDGVFDQTDYVLFYGQGPDRWSYNASSCPPFRHQVNLYSDTTYYFINVDLGSGKRIAQQASSSASANMQVTSFDDFRFVEDDNTNLIKSGREFYGANFDIINSFTFGFSFPNIDVTSPASVRTDLVSRNSATGFYQVSCQGNTSTLAVSAVNTICYYCPYAEPAANCSSFTPTGSDMSVTITKQTAGATGWLNYVEVYARRLLTMDGDQMIFRDSKSFGAGNISQFTLNVLSPLQIWDVSDPTTVKLQQTTLAGSQYQYTLATDSLLEFIAFTGNMYYIPAAAGKIDNQNLHALSQADLIIVANPLFLNDANTLANHHRNADGLTVHVVTPQQIYNEFSSGAQDVSAIRDFMKMFYDRATSSADMPHYLLLYGDGSYDNKNIMAGNTNFIPTYQSANSYSLTDSYVSDDFYGLLDNNEGIWGPSSGDLVDIGIGRIPVKSVSESQGVLNKILEYSATGFSLNNQNELCTAAQSSPFGDWRNVVCFIGDDEDGNTHETQANSLANYVNINHKEYNTDKIYFDAYVQTSTPGGNRYPGATDALNKRVEKGALIINYTGHGGEVGWAHERVLEVSDIESWTNINNLPLFVTATCEFSRWDDPARTSAGEDVLLNAKGGGIGLLTTVRLVYSSPNFTLNMNFYTNVFDTLPNGEMPRLGDVYRITKVLSGAGVNNRNFTLLGDPALRLAYPKYRVTTDSINGKFVSTAIVDTLRALSKVNVVGHITDVNGNPINTYNGYIYPSVFDKAQDVTTLSNDGASTSPPFTFKLQKNIIYKGKVSVTNGQFNFSFIVPKDIAYQVGIGRISYYAQDGNTDAMGYCEKIYVGGTSSTTVADANGPDAKLYMNDPKFVFGGTTNEDPYLYAIVKDSSGINTVGNGIGHDLTAMLDDNSSQILILNDYYQADLNSYKSGVIRYPLKDMTEGRHTVRLKVWDVYNNSTQTYTEFVVAKSAQLALTHVLNYPNPFTTKTSFYFEHNQCCELLDVQLQVFTISGKLVKTITTRVTTDGFRSEPIDWDGKDDYGDKIGRGVYVYHVKVSSSDGSKADKYEKLVILN